MMHENDFFSPGTALGGHLEQYESENQTVPTQIADGRLRLAISQTPVFIEP
jgi:hypothetical protein